jgi:hypothetical protein
MKKLEDEMPVELKLELLVDAELPEEERRELLLALDREPARWRELSMRFLERQVEKQAAREWIGTAEMQPPVTEVTASYPFPMTSTSPRRYVMPIAAGLLVAAVSATIALYAVHPSTPANPPAATPTEGPIATNIPGETMDYHEPVHMNVPIVNASTMDQPFFPPQQSDNEGSSASKRSVVIQPDGSGNAVVIPVNKLPMRFY